MATRFAACFDNYRNILTRKLEVDISTHMEMKSSTAVEALAALAQEHRLALFRLLVQAGDDGMPAGAIAEELGVPNSSLSFHLAHLTRSGLIRQRRQGRSLIYTADYAVMNALVGYLMENCCSGTSCAPAAQCAADAAQTQERKST